MSLLALCTAAYQTVSARSAGQPTRCPACEHSGDNVWERLTYTGRLTRRGAARCTAGSDDDTGWGPRCSCTDDFHRAGRARGDHDAHSG